MAVAEARIIDSIFVPPTEVDVQEKPKFILVEEKNYIQNWIKEDPEKRQNPFSLRSRIGQTMPLGDNKILIKKTGAVIETDENRKVSLVGKDGTKPLGITLYQLNLTHLK